MIRQTTQIPLSNFIRSYGIVCATHPTDSKTNYIFRTFDIKGTQLEEDLIKEYKTHPDYITWLVYQKLYGDNEIIVEPYKDGQPIQKSSLILAYQGFIFTNINYTSPTIIESTDHNKDLATSTLGMVIDFITKDLQALLTDDTQND